MSLRLGCGEDVHTLLSESGDRTRGDEPFSEEERAALEEAEEAVRRGDVKPLEEYLADRKE